MPVLIARMLVWFASGLAARLLLSLGLGIFTFKVLNDFQAEVQDNILNSMSQLPQTVIQLVGFFGVDQAISIILSAMSMAAFIKSSGYFIGSK